MKRKRLSFTELTEIERKLASLPYPLYVQRQGRGPVQVADTKGNFIQLTSYNQLPILLLFIQANCSQS
jgi:hypothetical protein